MKKIIFASSCFIGAALSVTETNAYTQAGSPTILGSNLYCFGISAPCFTDFNPDNRFFIPGRLYYIYGHGHYVIYAETPTPRGPAFPVIPRDVEVSL